jgi:ubiquinone/menaquinone biosynthesis C-methylase UbiE
MVTEHSSEPLIRIGRPANLQVFHQQCRQIAETLELARSDCVLDIGCGDGAIAEILAQSCSRWIGCDLSARMIKAAYQRAVPRAGYCVASATRLPFQDQTFDKVLIYSCLHYLNLGATRLAVAEAKRVCLPNGRILLGDLPDKSKKRAYEMSTGFGSYRKARSVGSTVVRYVTRRPRLLETWFSKSWVSKMFADPDFAVRILGRDQRFRFDALLLGR